MLVLACSSWPPWPDCEQEYRRALAFPARPPSKISPAEPRRTPWHTGPRSSPSDTAHPARALPSRGVQTIPSPLPSPHPPATSARELLRHNLRARASTPTRLPRSAAPCAHSPICLPYVAHTSYNVHTYVPAPRGAHNAPASTAACPFHMPPPTGEIPVKRATSFPMRPFTLLRACILDA